MDFEKIQVYKYKKLSLEAIKFIIKNYKYKIIYKLSFYKFNIFCEKVIDIESFIAD